MGPHVLHSPLPLPRFLRYSNEKGRVRFAFFSEFVLFLGADLASAF